MKKKHFKLFKSYVLSQAEKASHWCDPASDNELFKFVPETVAT